MRFTKLLRTRPRRPGSDGEHILQDRLGTTARADRFYDDQVCDRLLPSMIEFVGRMSMMFVATADARGECDSSLRAGPDGFVVVLDDRHVAYPEYRGNGVMASLGNIAENPHVGILMIDFVEDLIGLHVNGTARVVEDAVLRGDHPALPLDPVPGRRAELWVVVQVEEAYIHCRKHIPRLVPADRTRSWGTDVAKAKGGDFFGVAARRRAAEQPADPAPAVGAPDPRNGERDAPADPVVGRAGAGAAS
ncbi:pyridoxamine 5'-phosphate oxidase family protein [Actinomycetospora endophytica]|uniref:Pyridoxamine 5'-phosphate oxidase family protein n=1 Tax=Actinomycetospora endophytica TaxID=2291215 RepID=A0ABS8P782_9PSEU|nr:pyridoxamine 5'-phosphate oxidase family protein [Actinomycetospora endophytica]MCD2193858.1 pyridoxamine 5'-phosphate oxidase family protein [Actinomycetospora endophytica]